MKRTAESILVLATLLCPVSPATPVLELIPVGGSITGSPGETIGWGFTLTNDTDFLVVTGSDFTPATPIGLFTDFIGLFNFIVVGPAPESTTVSQAFSLAFFEGIGSFAIAPDAAAGSVALGQIQIIYDLFSRSPNDPDFNPFTDTISVGNILMRDASVTVGGAVVIPEPASLLLAGGALFLIWGAGRRGRLRR